MKENRESLYWLKLTKKSELVKEELIDSLIQEASELCSVLTKKEMLSKPGLRNSDLFLDKEMAKDGE